MVLYCTVTLCSPWIVNMVSRHAWVTAGVLRMLYDLWRFIIHSQSKGSRNQGYGSNVEPLPHITRSGCLESYNDKV